MMKKLIILCSLISLNTFAVTVPKDFESSTEGSWIHPKTLEMVTINKEKIEALEESNPLKEVEDTMKAKSWTLQSVMNIKDWQILDKKMTTTKDGSKVLWFFGSYLDSSKQKTYFAETYYLGKKGNNESYLFTRNSNEWTEKEIQTRFRIDE